MPKSREAPRDVHCSFCGTHKDDTTLIIKSTMTKASCCSACGLAIVEQTFRHCMVIEQGLRDTLLAKSPIVRTDQTDDAIKKAKADGNA